MSLFIILLLSGCAIFGGLAVFFVKKDSNQRLKLILSFSGAYLFAITILHLLPDVYQGDQTHLIGLFILGGFILQILLEQFSQGIEHGHIHLNSHQQSFPWGIMLSLCLHAFLEGMPLTNGNIQSLGSYYPYIMGVVIGIFLHISTTILFESSVDHKFSMKKTFAVLAGITIALMGLFLEA
jgi:zinc and cadmium transporter